MRGALVLATRAASAPAALSSLGTSRPFPRAAPDWDPSKQQVPQPESWGIALLEIFGLRILQTFCIIANKITI